MRRDPYGENMPFFAVTYTYEPDPDGLDEARPGHRAYLARLVEAGSLRAAGPRVGTTPPSALLLVVAAGEEEVAGLVAADPFHKAGLIASWHATRWDPVIGVFADAAG